MTSVVVFMAAAMGSVVLSSPDRRQLLSGFETTDDTDTEGDDAMLAAAAAVKSGTEGVFEIIPSQPSQSAHSSRSMTSSKISSKA